jgi:uncharacterized NAD(P)/FAD-binding protein YdhS
VTLTVAGGASYRLDAVVVASGHLPPDCSEGAYFGDPWHEDAITGIAKKAPVLLIGTGLTMVDVVVSLLDSGHRGPIRAISRRGLLPQVHAPTRRWDLTAQDLPRTTSVVRLMHWFRQQVRATATDGWDWRSVVDGLRPHLHDLWRRLSTEERRRFLRHLRPWWDTHRHRIAPVAATRLHGAIATGQLSVRAGRILQIAPSRSMVRIDVRWRQDTVVETLDFARAINCSGPETDYRACRDPLIRDLLARGFARPDPLRLGLEVSEQGALLKDSGQPSQRLFALGPITRGSFWEIVAVPDIRMHCARLAGHLMTRSHASGSVGTLDRRPPEVTSPRVYSPSADSRAAMPRRRTEPGL